MRDRAQLGPSPPGTDRASEQRKRPDPVPGRKASCSRWPSESRTNWPWKAIGKEEGANHPQPDPGRPEKLIDRRSAPATSARSLYSRRPGRALIKTTGPGTPSPASGFRNTSSKVVGPGRPAPSTKLKRESWSGGRQATDDALGAAAQAAAGNAGSTRRKRAGTGRALRRRTEHRSSSRQWRRSSRTAPLAARRLARRRRQSEL